MRGDRPTTQLERANLEAGVMRVALDVLAGSLFTVAGPDWLDQAAADVREEFSL